MIFSFSRVCFPEKDFCVCWCYSLIREQCIENSVICVNTFYYVLSHIRYRSTFCYITLRKQKHKCHITINADWYPMPKPLFKIPAFYSISQAPRPENFSSLPRWLSSQKPLKTTTDVATVALKLPLNIMFTDICYKSERTKIPLSSATDICYKSERTKIPLSSPSSLFCIESSMWIRAQASDHRYQLELTCHQCISASSTCRRVCCEYRRWTRSFGHTRC